ncbi:MAG: PKD domain-containing protein [Paracoccaceae bacterium]|uniref:PKD domain-containing protein n=1 Tax=Shimia thalassica TaxID=1715693 RepID=UPI00329920DD
MARFGFFGLSTGDSVRLTAGTREAQTGAEGWGANGPNATIQVHRSDLQVAPEGMNFEVVLENFDTPGPSSATGSYDPQFHDIHYVWNFGDPGKTYDRPAHILPEHRDANIAYGPLATHVYDTPGTYTVTVDIIEPVSGKTAQATLDVTIGNPDTQFPGFRTLYVDPDGDFSGAPAGAQLFDDLQAAFERTGQTSSDLDYFRIILNRGKVYSGFTGAQMRSNWKNVYWCAAPGAGARPLVQCVYEGSNRSSAIEDQTSHSNIGKITDINISGIDFEGVWNSRREEPLDQNINFLIHRTNRCTYLSIYDCTGSGFSTFVADQSAEGTMPEGTFVDVHTNVLSDLAITNWQNFAIYMDRWSSCGMVGCSFVQDVEAMSGGGKALGHNEHGPIRIHGGQGCVIDACDIFSRNGWFPNIVGMHTVQPGIRWNQVSYSDAKLNMQRTFVESPGLPLAITGLAPDPVAHNAIVDKCHLIGGVMTQEIILCQHSGVTVRNSVLVHPDCDRSIRGAFGVNSFVKCELRDDATPGTAQAPIRIYNNALVDFSDTSEGAADVPDFRLFGDPTFAAVEASNNLRYLPNRGETDHAIDLSTMFEPRYTDYRDYFHPHQSTLDSDVAPGESVFVPYSDFGPTWSRSDFTTGSADERYQPELNAGGNRKHEEDFVLSFSETGITIDNIGTATWPAGGNRIIVPVTSDVHIRPEFGSAPGSIVRAQPTPSSTAVGAALSGLTAVDDMLGRVRPAYPSIGAYELP